MLKGLFKVIVTVVIAVMITIIGLGAVYQKQNTKAVEFYGYEFRYDPSTNEIKAIDKSDIVEKIIDYVGDGLNHGSEIINDAIESVKGEV